MRARNIKPGFFHNEQLADCSSWARLLFPGLWMLADRCGRLEFRPKRWKAELFPYDNVDIEALFAELETQGLVVRYEAESMNLVWIPHFLDHQKPHKNERDSVLPIHPDDTRNNQGDCEEYPDDEQGTTKAVPEHDQGCADEQPRPLLARLIPDSSLLERNTKTGGVGYCAPAHVANSVPGETGASTEEQPASVDKPKRTDSPSKGHQQWPVFQSSFAIYPVQQGQEAAWREWMRLWENRTLPEPYVIRDAILLLMAEDTSWQRGMVPKMAKWLNEKGWDDKPFVRPAEAARASPGFAQGQPRAATVAQQRSQERDMMAKMLLAEEKNNAHEREHHACLAGETFAALPASGANPR